MLTRARAAVLVVAALTLAACGNVHPGSAAVVDGRSISMGTADETAEVYCQDRLLQQPGDAAISNADVRRQAILALVTLEVARDLADEQDLAIDRAAIDLPATSRGSVAEAFPDIDVDVAISVIEESREIVAIATALGEAATGETSTPETQGQLVEIGQAAITEAFGDRDVSFSPRFGLSPSGEEREGGTGSLAVSPIDLEAPADEELPVAQRCS